MARIRTIKPEFFTSEDIVSLSALARLLYIAVWCESDKEGRLAWKPKTLKIRYLPADECDIDALCGELVSAGLVRLYGDGLAYVPRFGAHQHVNPRETPSVLPDPNSCPTRAPRVRRSSNLDVNDANLDVHAQGGREGKGREVLIPPSPNGDGPPLPSRSGTMPDRPDGVADQTWADWLALRKAKRAPVTATVLADAFVEAGKAGMTLDEWFREWCARGSQGLRAEWLKPTPRFNGAAGEPAWRTEQRTRNRAMAGSAASKPEAIDAISVIVG